MWELTVPQTLVANTCAPSACFPYAGAPAVRRFWGSRNGKHVARHEKRRDTLPGLATANRKAETPTSRGNFCRSSMGQGSATRLFGLGCVLGRAPGHGNRQESPGAESFFAPRCLIRSHLACYEDEAGEPPDRVVAAYIMGLTAHVI